jgi:hypothetical protein
LRRLYLAAIAVLVSLGAVPPASAAPPAYSGTYVIINPYYFVDETQSISSEPLTQNKREDYDLHFLQCATELTQDTTCYALSSSNSDFLNPFTGVQWSSNGTLGSPPAANGILLRIPWCAFQIAAIAGSGEPAPTLGECHYQVWGPQSSVPVNSSGSIYAGAYTNLSSFAQNYQLANPPASDPQAGIDTTIGNLTTCPAQYQYDICSGGVMDTALGYIATIAAQMAAQGLQLKLSVALVAGQYTPTSVMNASGVTTLDFPHREQKTYTTCTRQPLAWHTTSTAPWATTNYELAYTAAVLALGQEIGRVMNRNHASVALNIIKESGITSNSIEFDVAAQATSVNLYTTTDPSLGPPVTQPQNDAAIVCPDHYVNQVGQGTMADALLAAYPSNADVPVITNAYEYTFGYIMGYEDGLAAQPGFAAAAMLSIPTKGQQAFAQVNCGRQGMELESACVIDDSTQESFAASFNWEDYYFFNFIKDLDISPSPATVGAAAGYAAACGTNCPAFPGTIAPSQMSVVNTGLDVSNNDPTGTGDNGVAYSTEPQCWINAPSTETPYLLELYSGSSSSTLVKLHGTGVILGWQTQTQSGQYCLANQPGVYTLNENGIPNGGQYFEIETDAAAETNCQPDLSKALGALISGSGNTNYICATSP